MPVIYYPHSHDWDDPIERGYHGPGWYFWDETQTHCYGPYKTKKEAEEKLLDYVHFLETGEKDINA